jgi:chromosomal replication initiation ATPase DnaA
MPRYMTRPELDAEAARMRQRYRDGHTIATGLPAAFIALVRSVARARGVSAADVLSRSRSKSLVAARREVAVELRRRGKSFPQIARWLGLCHTSVMHLCGVRSYGYQPRVAPDAAERKAA